MFGRRNRKRETEEAAREAERRALFEELAKRPDTVCPFLGLAQARAEYHPGVTDEHRCYAFGDPAELSTEQQHKVCLQRGYGNCPRYLRGVLVIPTEELAALRRPQPPTPFRPPPHPVPAPESGGRGRRGLVAVALVLLLLVGGGGAAFVLLNNGPVASQSPSPTPSATSTAEASVEPSPVPTPTATPLVSPTPEPTPAPGVDIFQFYEVAVAPGEQYVLWEVDDATGALLSSRPAEFDNFSQARVEQLQRADGSGLHWRTAEDQGEYAGLSYVRGASGPFRIRAVYFTPEGTRSSVFLPEEEL